MSFDWFCRGCQLDNHLPQSASFHLHIGLPTLQTSVLSALDFNTISWDSTPQSPSSYNISCFAGGALLAFKAFLGFCWVCGCSHQLYGATAQSTPTSTLRQRDRKLRAGAAQLRATAHRSLSSERSLARRVGFETCSRREVAFGGA